MNNKGSILLFSLIFITMLCLILAKANLFSYSITKLRNIHIKSLDTKNVDLSSISNLNNNQVKPYLYQDLNTKINLLVGSNQNISMLIGKYGNWQLFNTDLIFNKFSKCLNLIKSSLIINQVSTNYFTSNLVSTFTCQVTNVDNDQSYQENIFTKNLELNANKLSSLGFIEISESLLLKDNLTLFAGGDITINSIINNSNTTINLIIISATGKIRITNISGSIQIKAIAWDEIFLPINATLLTKTPYLLDYLVLGIT